jgi:hypothetical protein
MASGNLLLPAAATGELRHAGLRRDDRGVVVGAQCLLRFATLPELVGFVRLQALRGDLPRILLELETLSLLGEPGGADFALRLPVRGSAREVEALLDAVTLAGGQVFVGDGHHFVPFRDAAAPFGYDLLAGERPPRGLVLHRPAGSLHYPELRRIDLAELLFSLPLLRDFVPAAEPSCYVQVPPGLYRQAAQYLSRHGHGCEAALVELEQDARFGGRPQRSYLFGVRRLSAVGLRLLSRVPGVQLLARPAEPFLVPLGWRHPLPLEPLAALLPREALLVLRPEGGAALRLPALTFHPVLPPLLVSSVAGPLQMRMVEEPPQKFSLGVSLIANGRVEEATGLLVPAAQHDLLRRMLQGLPTSLLEGCVLAAGSDVAVVLGPGEALRHLPLGTLLKARTERVYLPVGMSLVPEPPAELLARLFVGPLEGEYIVLTKSEAVHFPARALLPLSRLMAARFYSRRIQLLSRPPEAVPASVEFPPDIARVVRRELPPAEPES